MQTLEWVWENEKVCENPRRGGSGLHKLSRSPKLPLVFASGYVNTARVLYFLNVILAVEPNPLFSSPKILPHNIWSPISLHGLVVIDQQ